MQMAAKNSSLTSSKTSNKSPSEAYEFVTAGTSSRRDFSINGHGSIFSAGSNSSGHVRRRCDRKCKSFTIYSEVVKPLAKVVFSSVFRRAFLIAAPSSLAALWLKLKSERGELGSLSGLQVVNNSAAYTGFNFILTFLITFRTAQAYSRFWEGCSLGHRIFGEWFDTASSVLAFVNASEVDRTQIQNFCENFLRLLSLLHASAVASLRNMDGLDFDLIDPDGFDQECVEGLRDVEYPVAVVYQWTMQLLTDNVESGVLAAPAPILTRLFHEFANGMVSYHDAVKFLNVQMPVAYQQITVLILMAHWGITPVVMVMWTEWYSWVVIFTFLQVFAMWAFFFIAVEIEFPFGEGIDNFPANEMQREFNSHLLLLLHPRTQQSPITQTLSVAIEGERRELRTSTRACVIKMREDADPRSSRHVVEFFPTRTGTGTPRTASSGSSQNTIKQNSAELADIPLLSSVERLSSDPFRVNSVESTTLQAQGSSSAEEKQRWWQPQHEQLLNEAAIRIQSVIRGRLSRQYTRALAGNMSVDEAHLEQERPINTRRASVVAPLIRPRKVLGPAEVAATFPGTNKVGLVAQSGFEKTSLNDGSMRSAAQQGGVGKRPIDEFRRDFSLGAGKMGTSRPDAAGRKHPIDDEGLGKTNMGGIGTMGTVPRPDAIGKTATFGKTATSSGSALSVMKFKSISASTSSKGRSIYSAESSSCLGTSTVGTAVLSTSTLNSMVSGRLLNTFAPDGRSRGQILGGISKKSQL